MFLKDLGLPLKSGSYTQRATMGMNFGTMTTRGNAGMFVGSDGKPEK
jgi:hypothetical protein